MNEVKVYALRNWYHDADKIAIMQSIYFFINVAYTQFV